MNPMEFESEQLAVIDHYARHGDQYERRTTAYPGRFAGLFNRNRGDGFHGDDCSGLIYTNTSISGKSTIRGVLNDKATK